jgi:hypothetical protein
MNRQEPIRSDAHVTRATCTAFAGHRRLATGSLRDVALAVKRASDRGAAAPILVFDDATGSPIELDLRGAEAEVLARLAPLPSTSPETAPDAAPRGRGRPRLGVVAREVTLLPRHWEWLGAQPGGASVALRRLVEEARRASAPHDELRRAREAAYRVMHAIAGDLPRFDEAARALFAGDAQRFGEQVSAWPPDVRDHLTMLAFRGAGG